MLGFILGVVIAAAATPMPQAQSTAACPREPVRIVEESNFTLPDEAHPTNDAVRFALDIGSDGRVRRTVLTESSGDPAIDAAAAQALTQFRFAAPTFGCLATSTVTSQFWQFPADMVSAPTPAPAGSPAPSASAAPASGVPGAACTAPFVRPARFAIPRHREKPGTAIIDVTLDADARVTAVHLVQSSGTVKTDYAATVAARGGGYVFVRVPGCPAGPTVYRLEMTFR